MKTGETIGTWNPDGLIIDGKHSLDVKGVTVKFTEAGTLLRGMLLAIGEDGKATRVTDAESGEEETKKVSHPAPDCILTDDISGEEEEEIYTAAYKSGNFARQILEERTGITLTEEDIETLRGKGIFVENVME